MQHTQSHLKITSLKPTLPTIRGKISQSMSNMTRSRYARVWIPNPSQEFSCNCCLGCWWIPFPLRSWSLMWFWRAKVPKKVSLSSRSCLAGFILLIGLSRGGVRLSGLFVVSCVRWWRKILITVFGIVILRGLCGAPSFESSMLALSVRGALERRLRSSFTICLSVRRGSFLWRAEVFAIIWDIWYKRNDRVFRGRERGHSEFWSLIRYLTCLFGLRFRRTFVSIL